MRLLTKNSERGPRFYKHFHVDINVKFNQCQSDNLSSNDTTDIYRKLIDTLGT